MVFDVVVVGAGPAGLCLVRSLAGSGLHIALVERQEQAALAAPADDGREIAITHRSQRLLRELGVWARLREDEIGILRDARVIDGNDRDGLMFRHGEAGQSQLGWLLSNHAIRRAAWAEVATLPGVEKFTGTRVTGMELDSSGAAVTLDRGEVLRAQLVVAADSRFSELRRAAGIGASMHDFGKTMLVLRMRHDAPHAQTAWEWFDVGQTLALLPLHDPHVSSVVLTLSPPQMRAVLALDDAALGEQMAGRFHGRLGHMHVAGPRCAYPLVGVYAKRFVAERFALVGDAAVGMHPVTAHGFNFGLLGQHVLARELRAAAAAGQPIWSPPRLHRYEREHRRATRPLYLATQLLAGLYTDDRPPARALRKLALGAAAGAVPAQGDGGTHRHRRIRAGQPVASSLLWPSSPRKRDSIGLWCHGSLDSRFCALLSGINPCLDVGGVAAQGRAIRHLAPRLEMSTCPRGHSSEGWNRTSAMQRGIASVMTRGQVIQIWRRFSSFKCDSSLRWNDDGEGCRNPGAASFQNYSGQQCAFAGMTAIEGYSRFLSARGVGDTCLIAMQARLRRFAQRRRRGFRPPARRGLIRVKTVPSAAVQTAVSRIKEHPMTRPSSFDYEQLRACGRGELFGEGNARLPSPPMLMFDRITHIASEGGAHGKGLIHAELDIHPELWFFGCHFIGDPVMPGCLGLDAMWQLSGFYLPWLGEPGRGRALGVGQVKFSGQVRPEAKLVRYEIDIRRVMRGRLAMVIADGRTLVDDRLIYVATDMRVGLFQSTEGF